MKTDGKNNGNGDSLGNQLERIRSYLNFETAGEFAAAMGIDPKHYAKIKAGTQPRFEVIRMAMDRVGIRLDYFSVPFGHPGDFRIDVVNESFDCWSEVGRLKIELDLLREQHAHANDVASQAIKQLQTLRGLLPKD